MKQSKLFWLCFLLYSTVFAIDANTRMNLFTKNGERLIAEFIRLANDTLYVRIQNPDSSYTEKALHKSLFSKVLFFSGEYLNLELSNFQQTGVSQTGTGEDALKSLGASITDTVDSAAKPVQNLAATDFEPRGGVSKGDAESLSDRFRERLIATNKFRVIERNQMDLILREQGFQQTGACRDNECLVQMGQLIAVQKIIAGSIGRVGSIYTISVKMLDVATGSIDRTISEDCDCPIEQVLTMTLDKLARKMANIESNDTLKSVVFSKGNASYFIKSNPFGAQIFIDGKRCEGMTPTTIKNIVPGDHLILLKKTVEGVEWSGQQVKKAVSNEIIKIAITLIHEQTTLQVNSNPSEAEVYINKKQSLNYFPHYVSPVILRRINPGTASIHFFKPGYLDTTLQMEIKPDISNEISASLVPVRNKEELTLQKTFTQHRLQRRIGKWTLLASVISIAFTAYYSYETFDNLL